MPKDTFHNLAPAKRDRLVAIALDEFANNHYASASISRIVAEAGIAKGSIYQYFEDKKDFYLYLIDHSSRVLLDSLADVMPSEPPSDIFELIRLQMSATVAAAARHPTHARLLERAFSAADLPFRDEVLARGRQAGGSHFDPLVRRAAADGLLNPEIEPEVATFVLTAVAGETGRFLLEMLETDADDIDVLSSPRANRLFDQIIVALRDGLAR